jgi:hypothetical protein
MPNSPGSTTNSGGGGGGSGQGPSVSTTSPQSSPAPIADVGTGVQVTDEGNAQKPVDQGEQEATRLMNDLLAKKKQGHNESAVGILNLLNVLYNNVRNNNNWLVERSAENVSNALQTCQRAEHALKENPNDPELQQKAANARQNFHDVLEKEKNFSEVYSREPQGQGILERLAEIGQKAAVIAPKLGGASKESFTIANKLGGKAVDMYNKNKENRVLADTSPQSTDGNSNTGPSTSQSN